MTPQSINEVRDLQPIVMRVTTRLSMVLALVFAAASLVVLAAAALTALADYQLHAVTQSGEAFDVPELAEPLRSKLLASPGAQALMNKTR